MPQVSGDFLVAEVGGVCRGRATIEEVKREQGG